MVEETGLMFNQMTQTEMTMLPSVQSQEVQTDVGATHG